MAVWAIADLHLSFGVPNKQMDVFGEKWRNHPQKIEDHWRAKITDDDLVLLAGDISWGMTLDEAMPDLEWIGRLPGTKVMIRGNHDFWWSSINKLRKALPSSIHAVQHDAFLWENVAIGGARMWDSWEYNFNGYVEMIETDRVKPLTETDLDTGRAEKIYTREFQRLQTSLEQLSPKAVKRIVMTHYPPLSATLEESRISKLLEKYQVDVCVFGHVHNMTHAKDPIFGEKNGVRYILTAADYINFDPVRIY